MSKGAQQRENPKKEEKGPEIREKEKIHPNSQTVSQQGSVGPSVSEAGGPERQVADLEMMVAAVGIQVVPWGCHWARYAGEAQDWYQ